MRRAQVERAHVDNPVFEPLVVGQLEGPQQVRFQPSACQARCTVAALTPVALARVRQLQCVWPSGFDSWVSLTISSIFSWGTSGRRPLPFRT